MFRNPLYLDMQLLRNLADYFGIELPTEAQVTRHTVDDRRGRVGVDKVVDLSRERGSSEEVTEVFSTALRPVRAMNDVIDGLLSSSDVVDLTTDGNAAFSQRDVIQIEGRLSISPVTEIGAVMAKFMPLMLSQVAAGKEDLELDPSAIGTILLDETTSDDFLHVLDLDTAEHRPSAHVLAVATHLFGSATIEDLDGDLTVLAVVDRMLDEGQSFSLERHLMPGLNRTVRRAMGSNGVSDLLDSFGELLGRKINMADISVNGPAVVLTPIAIY